MMARIATRGQPRSSFASYKRLTAVHAYIDRLACLGLKSIGDSTPPSLEVELELAAHGRTEAIEKLTKLRACDVILHISGVEVVSSIENSHTDACALSSHFGDAPWYAETFCSLHG